MFHIYLHRYVNIILYLTNAIKELFKALFNLSSHKGAVSYDEFDEKQIYSPFPNFRKEI